MYQSVYFDKTTRSAEVMLRSLFERFKQIISEKVDVAKIIPGIQNLLINSFSDETMLLNEYLDLDDHSISEFFKQCGKADDEILKQFGGGLNARKLYKCTDVTNFTEKTHIFYHEAMNCVHRNGLNEQFDLLEDRAADTPYKQYDPDDETPATQIYIENDAGKQVEIGTISKPVGELKTKQSLLRIYYPESIRDDIDAIAQQIFHGGNS